MSATISRVASMALLATLASACSAGDRVDNTATLAPNTVRALVSRTPQSSQALAALSVATPSRAEYRGDAAGEWFDLRGAVLADSDIRGDSLVSPTHDQRVCKQFRDVFMPRDKEGVGHAVVWISGVERGKPNKLPMRSAVRLNDCHLEPRVHVVSEGGTVLVGSRDAIVSRLRVYESVLGDPSKPRALVSLYDFGQIVPVPDIARTPALLEVRDDMHPWVRGFIAVAGHPYVTVTDRAGRFLLDSVPRGDYEIVVFSEHLGFLRRAINIPRDTVVELRMER